MNKNKCILYYKGFFNYTIVNKLLNELLEQSEALDISVFNKMQIVMVEMLENNYRYTSNKIISFDHADFFPVFKIIDEDKFYRLIASNPIKYEDVNELKEHLEKIYCLGLSGLRKWYKDILKDEIYSVKQSPGIGLIRIAKVVRNKFKYSFQEIDNKFLYYTLEILINKK